MRDRNRELLIADGPIRGLCVYTSIANISVSNCAGLATRIALAPAASSFNCFSLQLGRGLHFTAQ